MVKMIIIAISVIIAITNVLIIACIIKNQEAYSYSSRIGWPFVTVVLLTVGTIAMEIQTTIDNKDLILRRILCLGSMDLLSIVRLLRVCILML